MHQSYAITVSQAMQASTATQLIPIASRIRRGLQMDDEARQGNRKAGYGLRRSGFTNSVYGGGYCMCYRRIIPEFRSDILMKKLLLEKILWIKFLLVFFE